MDQIKEAFLKVKEDIELLNEKLNFLQNDKESIYQELSILREGFNEIQLQMTNLNESLFNLTKEIKLSKEIDSSTNRQTDQIISQDRTSTGNQGVPTNRQFFKPSNDQFYNSSTGNQGVPTNRQTDQQTDQQTDKGTYNFKEGSYNPPASLPLKKEDSLENALNLLNSLDNLKKEIRLKFKKLTDQETLVFSTLYQFDEEKGFSDYKTLSEKLNLSESSIRDYIGKLIQKGIPIEKIKVNNKQIQLKISSNLKKIASLPTILQLRDL